MSWQHEFIEQSDLLLLFVSRNTQYWCSPALAQHIGGNVNTFAELLATPAKFSSEYHLHLAHQYTVASGAVPGVVYRFEGATEQNGDWLQFTAAMSQLHELSLQLSEVNSEGQVIRIAVQFALEHLPLDRLGVLMLNTEKGLMLGTWGTDEAGELADEHDFAAPIPTDPWVAHALAASDYVAVNADAQLRHSNEPVGHGWNAMAALLDGNGVIGWVAVDNLLTQQPLYPWVREIIGQFGKTLATAINRTRQQQALRAVNDNLEALVDERSRQLQQKIELLQSTQKELVEAMKLASLGSLVAGLAHEVNTPVGVTYTTATHLQGLVADVVQKANADQLSKKEFFAFLESCGHACNMIIKNVGSVSHMVESFKMLAASNDSQQPEEIYLHQHVNDLIKTFHSQPGIAAITWQVRVDDDFRFVGYANDLTQILDCLVRNAILHGFNYGPGVITICARRTNTGVEIIFSDNGAGLEGVSASEIFDPFFTTRRANGGIGLGLNVVFNLVSRQGGTLEVVESEKGFTIKLLLPIQAQRPSCPQ